MKYISTRELRQLTTKVWTELERVPVVLAPNGKPEALVLPVNEDNLEMTINAIKKAIALLSVQAMQRQSVQQGTHTLSHEEIEAEIQAVRSERVN